jgi:hypothetical protein
VIISGTVTDPENDTSAIVIVFDNDLSTLAKLTEAQPSGVSFSFSLTVKDHIVDDGCHQLDVYALDASGVISSPSTFWTNCSAITPRATRSPAPSRVPEETNKPTRTPVPLPTLQPGSVVVIDTDELQDDRVSLQGEGTIVPPEDKSELVLSSVTIGSGSEIIAAGLVVTDELSLNGDAVLKAEEGGKIDIGNDQAVITFASIATEGEEVKLPSLDLGITGNNYSDKPKEIILTIRKEDFVEESFTGLDQILVEGRNLTNCEEWRLKVVLPVDQRQNFETYCKLESAGESVRRLLAGEAHSSLRIRKKQPDTGGTPNDDNGGLSTGAKIAIGIIVPVVVIAIVVAVILVMKKGGGGSGSSSVSSGGGQGGNLEGLVKVHPSFTILHIIVDAHAESDLND